MNKKTYKIKETLSNALELPKDIILDVAKVTLIGSDSITVENHKGILEYNEDQIRVNTGSGVLIIIGSKLNIKSILQEEITITGEINSVGY
ncbi:MAG: sporulation protein YqfC [Clostridiales bacterium GWB2_37_7]|nr:MAG: sporulation protein YqfC [Clostridiales bacterium GWB2_37_7]